MKEKKPTPTPETFPAGPDVCKLREVAATTTDTVWGDIMRETVAEVTPECFPDAETAAVMNATAGDILRRIEKHGGDKRGEAGHMAATTAMLNALLIGGGTVVCSFLHYLGLM